MPRFCHLLYLLFVVTCCCSQTANNSSSVTQRKTYAIVIGISGYQNQSLPQLKYADKDALLFSQWLQTAAGGNVPEAQIKILLNKEATIAAVYNAIDWVKEQCNKEDLVYFYFSGHGDVETENNFSLGYLLAYNTPPNNYRNNAIKIEDINNDANFLSTQKQAKVILITDACHSGKLAGDFYKGKHLVGKQLQQVLNNEVRLTSCAVDEEAAEGMDWGEGRGVFSYYLLQGINGMANYATDGSIKLNELQRFLDSAFVADKILRLQNHKQHPVIDGNPNFIVALLDTASVTAYKRKTMVTATSTVTSSSGLSIFKKASIQPIDYFFAAIAPLPIESILNLPSLQHTDPSALAVAITNQFIIKIDTINQIWREKIHSKDWLNIKNENPEIYASLISDSSELNSFLPLKNQLSNNKLLAKRFIEKLVELVHNRTQEMINAYLSGDIAELEKRQYYYSGNRQYGDFLSLLNFTLQLIPKEHHLANVLTVNATYLAGLMARLSMATLQNTDSLLEIAIAFQRKTLQAEPYAGYIHNEIGNLLVHQKKYDSANYHYNFATSLAPSWAIPFSNKIRMYLIQHKLNAAAEALHKADSLQPNMAFVLMNGGLVMEQQKNWLAAESYFLKAIKQNNVHYLPYEHLGNIYLQTGRYALSNEYFDKAAIRKESFAINDAYFRFGVELGGLEGINEENTKLWRECYNSLIKDTIKLQPFTKFLNGIKLTEPTLKNTEQGLQLLKEVAQQNPFMPLVQHYIGAVYYTKGLWQQAEAALIVAIANYKDDAALKNIFKEAIYGKAAITDDTCLLNYLMLYQYNTLEDYYMLAHLYEKTGVLEKAIDQYKKINAIEIKLQQMQANYEGYTISRNSSMHGNEYEVALTKYEMPIKMGGAIKTARLYQQLGNYEQAEKVLLNQVMENRAAGNARRRAMDENKPGTYQISVGKINFYWLLINKNLETETYNFYKKMMDTFPRNYYWKQNAGLFLYKRLQLAYQQMPIERYQSFTESLIEFEYPFTHKEVHPNEEPIIFNLPTTGEEIVIPKYIYNPVKEALAFLLQSVQLSGAVEPTAETTQAIAALYTWQGNYDTASIWYKKAVAQQPADTLIRNNLVDVFTISANYVAAQEQLDTLYLQQKISRDKILQLINYDMLSNKYQKAASTLKKFKAIDDIEKCEVTTLYATNFWLQGKTEQALQHLLSFPVLKKINKEFLSDEDEFKNEATIDNLYAIARMYALLKQYPKAISFLTKALDTGFKYDQVLYNDTVWNFITAKNWDKLIAKYQLGIDYATYKEQSINPIGYRIPDQGEGYKQ